MHKLLIFDIIRLQNLIHVGLEVVAMLTNQSPLILAQHHAGLGVLDDVSTLWIQNLM